MTSTERISESYYAIIPANVRYDDRLTANAKLLYGEITALCNKEGYCWASNGYFARLYNVSHTTVSKWIRSLIECGYIKSELIYKKGTKEIENRYLSILNTPIYEKLNTPIDKKDNGYVTKVKYPIDEKLNTPIDEKLNDNNTSINITVNNTSNKEDKKKSIDYKAIANAYKEICISYSAIRHLSEARKKAIRARINAGYTHDDFITLFKMAQESDFLKGDNSRKWKADFDWLIKDANMAKVLDGKYANKNITENNQYNYDYGTKGVDYL